MLGGVFWHLFNVGVGVGVGVGLPAHIGGKVSLLLGGAPCPPLWLPALWVGFGRAWAFAASGLVYFRPLPFCLQAGFGCSGLALGFAFRVGL